MAGEEAVFAWDTPTFRTLLAQQQPGAAFALVRSEHGLSQAQFGVLVNWGRTNTGRIERGERQTLYDIRELVRVADALGIPRRKLLPILLGTSEAGTIEDIDSEGVDDVDRRQFGQFGLTVFGTAMFVGLSAPASANPLVGADHVRYLSGLADTLWAQDNEFGSGGLLPVALDQYTVAKRLLETGEYSNPTGSALAAATARLAECAGWLAFDSRDHDTAQLCYFNALTLAERSGSDARVIDIIDGMQWQASHFGRHREALQLSLRATELARNMRSARLHAMLAARQAAAYAAVGDARGATAAISQAWREVDRGLDDPNDTVGLLFVTPAEIQVIEARTRSYLGEHDKAVATYREAISSHPLQPRDEASYRAYYASALAQLGDTRTAITEGLSALTMLEGTVTSPRLVAELAPVRAVAKDDTADAAGEFRHRFDALTVHPSAA